MSISSAVGNVGTVPIGSVTAFAGSTAPSGWLLCAGQTVSRTQYSGLFLTIGTTYGAGDGSTTFALPDLRGRVPAGLDNMGGTDAGRLSIANTLGTSTGAETFTISSSNLPPHTHTLNNHTHSGTTGNDSPDHSHGTGTGNSWILSNRTASTQGTGGASAQLSAYLDNTSGASTRHTHSFSTGGPSNNNTSDGGFANTAIDKMQPTIILNYIIKAA